jgi:hypothetical protein
MKLDATEIAVLAAATGLIALVIWYFFGKNR